MSGGSRIIPGTLVHPPCRDHRHGGAVRDYVHVDDVASASGLALAACCPAVSAIYTVGAAAASATGVFEAAEQVIGRPIRVTRSPPRSEAPIVVADNTRIRADRPLTRTTDSNRYGT
jgi:UDP-glucose 4-epimerase